MIDTLLTICRVLLAFLPFFLFVMLAKKVNLEKDFRSRQVLMPFVAVLYCIALAICAKFVAKLLIGLLPIVGGLLTTLGEKICEISWLEILGRLIAWLGAAIIKIAKKVDSNYLALVLVNTVALLVFFLLKRVVISIMRPTVKPGTAIHDRLSSIAYEPNSDKDEEAWVLRNQTIYVRTFVHTFYIAAIVISILSMVISVGCYKEELFSALFYPAYAIIIIGEVYFFLDGNTAEEKRASMSIEEDRANSSHDYSHLRKYLKRLFEDKLVAEDSTNASYISKEGVEQILAAIEKEDNPRASAYAKFMRSRIRLGQELDVNYLASGFELTKGNSVLFNTPFYYDLIPYAFFAMDRTLLRRKKVMIICGRHGAEEDLTKWCEEGFFSISGVPGLWNIGVLGQKEADLDVGIITRSDVHNRRMAEANRSFFSQVGFVFLVEPSKLIATAQVGLNSLIRKCQESNKGEITYCSVDKNCDGLLDALSHALMTSIQEVTATNRQSGSCSYMCWAGDEEYWQHRMMPNIARYLGIGTELSFVALKHQISHTVWYGGEAFPVVDMRWIVRQYYYNLLQYAGLPVNQENIDNYFQVSSNPCNERVKDKSYITVEDEAYNMFEVKRAFSTRADSDCFINVISSEYLLRDYMASNNEIFDADPKAIPYIVADYARTRHNTILRLCLQLASGYLREQKVRYELTLLNGQVKDITEDLWKEICCCCGATVDEDTVDEDTDTGIALQLFDDAGKPHVFTQSVLRCKRDYCIESGKMENIFYISDKLFDELLLSGLQSAEYIAEDENDEGCYLGSELLGHIYQKYLPGQFFTFCGKYYEMLNVTPNGKVMVRRASDHITGRQQYRQVRQYTLLAAEDAKEMGACKTVGNMKLTRQYADFTVSTPAYWQMNTYNDFAHGKKVSINGIPERKYYNKQILRIDFSEEINGCGETVCRTLTLLINEVFRSLFAENQDYIVALCSGEAETPLTYSLHGADGFVLDPCSIYIFEDSQLDIGLLVAVERNIHRIFSIVCDWLAWHKEQLEMKDEEELPAEPPKAPNPPTERSEEDEETAPKKKKCIFARIWQKCKDFFSRIFKSKKKKKKEDKKTKNAEKDSPNDLPAEDSVLGDEENPQTEAADMPDTEISDDAGNEAMAELDELDRAMDDSVSADESENFVDAEEEGADDDFFDELDSDTGDFASAGESPEASVEEGKENIGEDSELWTEPASDDDSAQIDAPAPVEEETFNQDELQENPDAEDDPEKGDSE